MDPTSHARDALARYHRRVARDWLADDPHLRSLLRHHGVDADELSEVAKVCAERIDPLARETNLGENLPRLARYDGVGNRTESVVFHPGYHELGRLAYGTGIMAFYAAPGDELRALARLYLIAQNGEAGHTCPMACTAGLIRILQAAGDPRPDWTARLLDPDYDTHFHGAQWLTEVQGGSDVGANGTVAQPDGAAWRLRGEKWFCSVADAHLFLVTARPEGAREGTAGLRAFVVPRHLDDGRLNAFRIRRLKDKLGTRSMASAEVDLEGAWALDVGDFRRTVDIVLNTSRVYNAVVSCGMMQRAWREAHAYAHERRAFGVPIARFPAVARIVARLRVEAAAARGLAFRVAALGDRRAAGDVGEAQALAWRFLVSLLKYWTSHVGTASIRDAIEVLGGNGAIESFSVLPRLLRDSVVCEAWEGGHNVLCSQALRDAARFGAHQHAFDLLEQLDGTGSARLARARARWDALVALPADRASLHVRDLADELRPLAQAAALRAEARDPGSDPLLPEIVDHLLATSDPGHDPLEDRRLGARVEALAGG